MGQFDRPKSETDRARDPVVQGSIPDHWHLYPRPPRCAPPGDRGSGARHTCAGQRGLRGAAAEWWVARPFVLAWDADVPTIAKLAISIARKMNALIFLVPEDIVDVRPRLVRFVPPRFIAWL